MELVVDLSLPLHVQQLLKYTVLTLCDLVRADGASILLTEGDNLVIRAYLTYQSQTARLKLGKGIKMGERVAGHAAATGETVVVIGDVNKDVRFSHITKYENILSGLSSPIMRNGKCLGVVNLKRIKVSNPMSDFEVDIVKTFTKNITEFI